VTPDPIGLLLHFLLVRVSPSRIQRFGLAPYSRRQSPAKGRKMRGWVTYIPWCLIWLLLGCQARNPDWWVDWDLMSSPHEQIELASVRVWSESRPFFPNIRAEAAALAWSRNLKALDLRVKRNGAKVEGTTANGQAFRLTFVQEKDGVRGEITWLPPQDAGAGMLSLIDGERKLREEKERRQAEVSSSRK